MYFHNPKLAVWGSDIEIGTVLQAEKMARMTDVINGHIALMPDAHIGMGATVGTVAAMESHVIPAAVGVDIGCGMAAVKLNITASQLPDNLDTLMPLVEQAVPAGVGKGRGWNDTINVSKTLGGLWTGSPLDNKLQSMAISQCGTLGSGNHFLEIDVDENDDVWIVLHSGSRGIGNKLATLHINGAKKLAKANQIKLEDPDLAYLIEGTEEFGAYIADMLWSQRYALLNREVMLDHALATITKYITDNSTTANVIETERINCHHNFTQPEIHNGQKLWITRKGAIKADHGDLGIIPGSMGTETYIVRGLGNSLSWNSCSHGAGRKMSRSAAKKTFTTDDLNTLMLGKVWRQDHSQALLDEIPSSYKDIKQVMDDQKDLVEVVHTMNQVFNYKGA